MSTSTGPKTHLVELCDQAKENILRFFSENPHMLDWNGHLDKRLLLELALPEHPLRASAWEVLSDLRVSETMSPSDAVNLLDVFGRQCRSISIRASPATVDAVVKNTGALRALRISGDRISNWKLQELAVANPNLEKIWFGDVSYHRKNPMLYSMEYMREIIVFFSGCKQLKTISFEGSHPDGGLLWYVSHDVRASLRNRNVSVRVNNRELL